MEPRPVNIRLLFMSKSQTNYVKLRQAKSGHYDVRLAKNSKSNLRITVGAVPKIPPNSRLRLH